VPADETRTSSHQHRTHAALPKYSWYQVTLRVRPSSSE
jgi:hypothetical protein